MLASTLLMQKREASAIPARIDHPTRENPTSHSSHISSAVRPVATHTQTETQEAYKRHTSQVKEHELSKRKLEITYNSEQLTQSKENTQLYQNSLKRNFILDFLLKSKEITYSEKQNLR